MKKTELIKIIERFAPLELQEKWDCSGNVTDVSDIDVKKVMIALTPSESVVRQAIDNNCDMIITHHPLFYVPLWFKGVDIYCAHTNLDKTLGGTTDTLIDRLGFSAHPVGDFVRIAELTKPIAVIELAGILKKVSSNVRLVNNYGCKKVSQVAFCAGSGMGCLAEAAEAGADCFITGDIKYHDALDSDIVLFDIGHFESEKPVLATIAKLIKNKVEVCFAEEQSPFKTV